MLVFKLVLAWSIGSFIVGTIVGRAFALSDIDTED